MYSWRSVKIKQLYESFMSEVMAINPKFRVVIYVVSMVQ